MTKTLVSRGFHSSPSFFRSVGRSISLSLSFPLSLSLSLSLTLSFSLMHFPLFQRKCLQRRKRACPNIKASFCARGVSERTDLEERARLYFFFFKRLFALRIERRKKRGLTPKKRKAEKRKKKKRPASTSKCVGERTTYCRVRIWPGLQRCGRILRKWERWGGGSAQERGRFTTT
jgi:hypothetical protein